MGHQAIAAPSIHVSIIPADITGGEQMLLEDMIRHQRKDLIGEPVVSDSGLTGALFQANEGIVVALENRMMIDGDTSDRLRGKIYKQAQRE